MTELADKIKEALGAGHAIPPAVADALLSIDERLEKLEGKKDDKKEPDPPKYKPVELNPAPPNPLDGTRIDS